MFWILLLFFSSLLFTPIRTPIVLPRDEDKTPETLEKECAKRKYFALLSAELHEKFGLEIEPYDWPVRDPEIYFVVFTTYYPDRISSLRSLWW